MPRVRLHPFERGVLATIRRRRLLRPGDRVLAALSGGPDSTALVAALAALRDAGALSALAACHVDHGLRTGSAEDGIFCAALCSSLGVPLERAAVAVEVTGGAGLQAAARRARYAALRRAAARTGATRLATGHTRGDQAETVLLRLLRGAGARGLAGIPPRRGTVVRPLIDRSRAEVLRYLAARGVGFREDPSNASARFLRNRVRAEALPALEAIAPGVEARLARAADLLRDDDACLESEARAGLAAHEGRAQDAPRADRPADRPAVELARLAALPPAVRRRALRRLWRAATGSRRGLSAQHVEAALGLLGSPGPWRLALPGGREVRCAYGVLEMGSAAEPGAPPRFEVEVPGPGRYAVPGLGAALVIEVVGGAAAVPWPLVLRTRRPGDRFRQAGGPGDKKLKAWLIDRKVPRARREELIVLADAGGRVLALPELGARSGAPEGLHVRLDCKGPPRLL